jgi:hypothetical protein
MKELAMHISRLDFRWLEHAFVHNLTYALQDVALADI